MKKIEEMSLRELVEDLRRACEKIASDGSKNPVVLVGGVLDYISGFERLLPEIEAAVKGMETIVNKGHANSFGQFIIAECYFRGLLDAYRAAKERREELCNKK